MRWITSALIAMLLGFASDIVDCQFQFGGGVVQNA